MSWFVAVVRLVLLQLLLMVITISTDVMFRLLSVSLAMLSVVQLSAVMFNDGCLLVVLVVHFRLDESGSVVSQYVSVSSEFSVVLSDALIGMQRLPRSIAPACTWSPSACYRVMMLLMRGVVLVVQYSQYYLLLPYLGMRYGASQLEMVQLGRQHVPSWSRCLLPA